jgi:hypothetical protein
MGLRSIGVPKCRTRRSTRADVPQAYVHDADLFRDHARAGLL